MDHIHKHLISTNDLTAGTGFSLEYNDRIKSAALKLHKTFGENNSITEDETVKKKTGLARFMKKKKT